jgi:hypothetical protein
MDDLHTLGFKGDSFEGVDPRAKGHHSFSGTEIEWFCTHENDQNGNPRERWGPRGRGRLLDADKIRKLNRLLFKKPQSADGSTVEENDSAEITDADVPF